MFAKTVVVLCIQLALFNVAYTQVLNRIPLAELQNLIANNLVPISPNIVPIGPNVVPVGPCGNIVPIGPNIFPVGSNIVPVAPNVVESVYSAPVTIPAPTTIIQDSSVANNLANALQLLVVSNLLSNTLPTMGDVVVPNFAASPVEVVSPYSLGGLQGYSFVY